MEGGEVRRSQKDDEAIDIEYELLNKSVGWFTLHKIGQSFCRVIFSHGLLVIWVTILIAILCHNAYTNRLAQKTINLTEGTKNQENKNTMCTIVNELTLNNEIIIEKDKKNNAIPKISSSRNKNRRNECNILK
jgi:hypothetical protein